MTPIATARDWWQHLAPDGEQQMVVNRLLVGLLALLFNGYAAQRGLVSGLPLIAPCLYMALGLLVLLHLLWHRGPSVGRRAIALMLDCAAASYELHIGGAATVWQFSGYLWIIFGNGFRFGPRFLAYSMLVSMIGFGLMVAVTPYWRDNPAQIVGGLIGLAIVPLYALSLINRLSLARRQAEEASRAKSLFLASVSHELRTPLNSIIGIGAMLERTDLEPEQWQMSRTIMTAARSLLSLIDGVLDLSKAESGRTTTTSGDFNLAQLLQEVRSIFAAQARLKGLDINLHVTARTPLLLHGDARILHEILMNLVGNGMKFTEAGSITVTVDATEQQDDRLRLRFAVTDTGIGIALDAQKRIFEVFTQADNTIVNRFGGTGLGLAIARKSVQLLGGEIGVESVPNQGSVFWFALPLRMQARLPAITPPLHALVLTRRTGAVAPLLRRLTESGVTIEALDAPPPGWPVSVDPSSVCLLAFRAAGAQAPRGGFGPFIFIDVCEHVTTGLPPIKAQRNFASTLYLPVADDALSHVLQLADILVGQDASTAEDAQPAIAKERFALLVADDNATNRYVMETILSSAGHVVTLASNGEQALDLLAARHFDAAVLDLNMPVMGGIEAAKMYRMITDTDAIIPLIALTADATTATRDSCLAAGMAACLVKPIEPQKLLEMIDEIVVKARDGQPPQAVASADSRVVAIAAHPRFRGNLVSPVNLDVLTRLHKLGGTAFLFEVCTLFRDEAHATMLELDSAAKLGDVSRFRTNAHALRSVAANVGAQHLCDICRPFQSASASELLQNAKSWLALIAEELARVDDALTHYCDSPSSQSQR